MGNTVDLLCYFIEYFSEENPEDKVQLHFSDEGKYEYELKSLMPYQRYCVYLQCALTCGQIKSLPAGPVAARTPEEEPQDQVKFQDWSEVEVDHNARNVTVFLKIPDKEKWNGCLRQIRVFCYKDNHLCRNVTLDELVVSDGWQHRLKYSVTFPSLRRDTTYNVQADYCNSIGCSPRSRNQTIIPTPPAEQDSARFENPRPNESLPKEHLVGIIVGCAVVIIIAVIITIFIIRKCNRNNEPRRNLTQDIGQLPPSPTEDVIPEEQADTDYSTAFQAPRVSKSTLNPETTDFQSASVRSINSFNSIGGLTDQSKIRDYNSESIPHHEEPDSNQESVALFGKEADSPLVKHRPSQEDELLLHTPV